MRPSTRRLFRTVIVLSLVFVVLGLARGWFYISRPADTDSNKVNLQFTVDTAKVKDDSAKVKDAAAEVGDKVASEARDLTHKVADRDVPPPAPLEQPKLPDNTAPRIPDITPSQSLDTTVPQRLDHTAPQRPDYK